MKIRRIMLLLLVSITVAGCGGGQKKNNAEVHYILGLSYLQEQNPTLALKDFLLAEQIDPADARIQSALAQAYQLKKAFPEAEKHYLRSLALTRNDPHVENNLAALYLDMGRWEDAIRLFRKAAANLLFTHPEVALSGAGFGHFQLGQYPQAITAYEQALAHNPRYSLGRLRLGEALFAIDQPEKAIVEFRRALVLAPDFVQAHYKLGLAYMQLRKRDEALRAFREVVRLAPDDEPGTSAKEYIRILQ